jgi:hypothetical protein
VPPSTFTGQFLRKGDILGLVSFYIFDPWLGDFSDGGQKSGQITYISKVDFISF